MASKVVDYKLVCGFVNPDPGRGPRFEDSVNELIRTGWQPIGGPTGTGSLGLCQAMVKFDHGADRL